MLLSLQILVILLAVIAYQHYTYQQVRRSVGDQLNLFSLDTLTATHLVTIVKVTDSKDLVKCVGRLKKEVKGMGGRVVYLGRKVIIPYQSSQLDAVDWDAVVLSEWQQESNLQSFVQSPPSSIPGVEEMFHLGMNRNPALNFMIPLGLGLLKLKALALGGVVPFEEDAAAKIQGPRAKILEALGKVLTDEEVDSSAVVVLNFLKDHEDDEIRRKNDRYGMKMMHMLAEVNGGPLHIGAAQSVMNVEAKWDTVALVYYPGVSFMIDLIRSKFIGIAADKKLGDTLAIFTTPLRV